MKRFKEVGDVRYIYQNQLDKTCFQHDMTCGDFKNLNRGAASDKILRDKTFNIVKNPKYYRYQYELSSMIYKFFDKKTLSGAVKNENIFNKLLVAELQNTNYQKI